MTQPENNQPTGQEPAAVAPPAAPAAPPAANAKSNEWYEAELAKVRQEAAAARIRAREAETKNQPTLEDLNSRLAAQEERANKAEREAMVATVGRDLPDDLLQVLADSKAKTKEELEAKAKTLREYALKAAGKEPPKELPPEKLGGGLTGGAGEGAFNAAEIVKSVRARRG